MEFLLANHPLDCPICDQGGECDLQVSLTLSTRKTLIGSLAVDAGKVKSVFRTSPCSSAQIAAVSQKEREQWRTKTLDRSSRPS